MEVLSKEVCMDRSIRNMTTTPIPVTANEIVARHFKGQDRKLTAQIMVPQGIMPIGTFLVCGECSDEGGGSSGQCACH